MPFLFEDLEVYKKAIAVADDIGNLTDGFPKGSYYLSDQLNRATLSVATNIAEGNGRFHKAERKNFFRIARGSAFGCIPILDLCYRRHLISQERNTDLKTRLEEISRMLTGLTDY